MVRTLTLALTVFAVLVSAIARPPGVMAVASDDGVTYEICSEGALRIVTLAPDGSLADAPQGEKSDGAMLCKFFAVHAALPAPDDTAVLTVGAAQEAWIGASSSALPPSPLRHNNPPRAPPLV